jgi:molybdopterin-guanine dinucleotide biosynthesis protein A
VPDQQTVKLTGLVLAGGKSERMGTDKCMLNWHGKEQCYYLADLLQQTCTETFISCRPEQARMFDPVYAVLPDNFTNIGPLGGILTALQAHKNGAVLAIACDLPLLNPGTIRFLVDHRNPLTQATAFINPADGLPEPMITIWEPAISTALQAAVAAGNYGLRKILLANAITLVHPPHPEALLNANTPEEAQQIREILNRTGGPDNA